MERDIAKQKQQQHLGEREIFLVCLSRGNGKGVGVGVGEVHALH